LRRALADSILYANLHDLTPNMPAGPLTPVLNNYRTLAQALESLTDTLEDESGARVFASPLARDPRTSGGLVEVVQVCIEDEGDGIGAELWDQPIPVKDIAGAEAGRRARAALQKLVRHVHQLPDRPDRLPGLIWVPHKRVASATRAVNAAKRAFEEAVHEFSRGFRHHKERAQAFAGTELQHVLLLQAYRQIPLVTGRIEKVSFSWSGASRTVRRMTVREATEWIASLARFGTVSEWTRRVAAVPGPYVARVRRQAPYPIANIKVDGHWNGDPEVDYAPARQLMAHLPIVLTGPEWPEVNPLLPYEPGAQPGKRGDRRLASTPLIPELGLYEYVRQPLT
jgi:hypothetical protein